MKDKMKLQITEDKLKTIIDESVQEILSENLKCSEGFVRQMYTTMCSWQKIDCPIEGYDEFKSALNNAVEKLSDILWRSRFNRPRPTSRLNY